MRHTVGERSSSASFIANLINVRDVMNYTLIPIPKYECIAKTNTSSIIDPLSPRGNRDEVPFSEDLFYIQDGNAIIRVSTITQIYLNGLVKQAIWTVYN